MICAVFNTAFNVLVLFVGTLSFAGAFALLIAPPLTKHWSRRWLRVRLGTTSHKITATTPPKTSTATSATTSPATSAPRTSLAVTDFLDAIARDVRSGFSLASSFVQCSDQQPDSNHWSQPVAQQCLRGVVLADALVECALPTWTPEIRFASRTLAVASSGGAGVAPALEHSASVLREQQGLMLDRDVQAAQAHLSTKVLTWLPIAVFAWIAINDSVARGFLLGTPVGMCCVATGIALNVSGRKWMSHVVDNISV
jgi:tight adherence protein B